MYSEFITFKLVALKLRLNCKLMELSLIYKCFNFKNITIIIQMHKTGQMYRTLYMATQNSQFVAHESLKLEEFICVLLCKEDFICQSNLTGHTSVFSFKFVRMFKSNTDDNNGTITIKFFA